MSTDIQAPAKQGTTKLELMQGFFQKDTVRQQLQNVFQDNANVFIASVIDLYVNDANLLACPPELVAMQAMKAAVLKLPVIKALGYAYIIPFKNAPTLIIGYKGFVQLAIRSQMYRIINADVVYEGEYRTANKLTGEFDLTGDKKSDRVIGYFAHFEMLNGFSKTLFMTRERVDAHAKKFSKTYNSQNSVWKTDFDAMALKTVIRGLFSKWGYMSVEMQGAVTDDDVDVAKSVMDEVQQNGNKKPINDFPPVNTGSIQEAEMSGDYQNADLFNQNGAGPGF